MDVISYALSKKIAEHAVSGVQSMSVSGQTLTINTKDSGVLTMTFPTPKDGVSVTDIDVNANNQIVFTMSDGTEFISGKIPTVKGDKGDPFKYSDFTTEQLDSLKGSDGFSPTATVEKVGKVATITITDKNGTTTATIKDGEGSEGGEANTIDSISVNGVNVVPDENKNVDITVPSIDGLAKIEDIPTKVSELTNDSGYLTEHQDISGKVDKVEGKSLISDTEIARLASVDNYDDTDIKAEIAKKADTTEIPSKVSELTNDSNYQTAEQVNSTVTTEIAKVVADAPEDLNTLKEMSDWIAGHENDASAMNSAISDNKIAITALQTGKADKTEIPTTVAELTDSADYAKTADIPTTLPANGGNSDTVNNHTVETDVPTDAVFTDTIYDDTEVKESIAELSSNLDALEYSDIAGGKNLLKWNTNKTITYNGVTFDATKNGKLKLSGTSSTPLLVTGFMECTFTLPQGTYTISSSVGGNTFNLYAIDGSTELLKTLNGTFTLSKETEIYLGKWTASGTDMNYDIDLQIEEGSTATPYEPYIPSVKMLADKVNAQQSIEAMDLKMLGWNVPSEFPIQNEVSGNQFIQKVGRVDLGELAWSYTTNPNRFLYYLANIKSCDVMSIANVIVTDKLSVTTFDNVYSHASDNILGVSGQNIGVYASSYTDVESFKNAMKGVYLYYELATPITKTIDGNEAVEELSSNLSQLEFGEVAGGKNLLNPIWQTSSNNGIEFINNGDGSFTIKGTAVHPELSSYSKSILIPVEVGKTYKLTGNCISAYKKDNIQSILENNSTTSESTFTATEDAVNICLYVGANTDNIDITSKYMLTEATNTSEYEPYIPSVKALAEEVGKQNESLEVIGKCKNLLKPTLETVTKNGVTCTNNGDGTYTLNGTATGGQPIFWLNENVNVTGSNLKLVCCPPNVLSDKQGYSKIMYDNNEWGESESGDGVVINSGKNILKVIFTLNDGNTVNNLVIKPMLTTNLSATYDDFVPYTGYGDTLTHDVAKLNDNLSALGKCKNLLNPILQTTTLNGVTCTNNGDGTYTLNGTATNNATFIFANTDDTLATFKGHSSLKLVGFPKKYASAGVLQVWRQSNELIMRDKGDGVIITGSNMPYGDCNMAFIIYDGAVTDGMIIKPMVTTNLNATYDDFVPYTGDGETLTHDIADLKNDLGGLSFSASGTTLSITDGTHTWTLEANS